MSYFIAIDIPEDIKIEIRTIQKQFEKYAGLKFVGQNQLHLTLVFLGDIDNNQLNETKDILRGLSGFHTAIRCHLSSMGVFPNTAYIKVVWIGISAGNDLFDLQNTIAATLRKRGIFKLDNEFKPHITIARVRNAKNKDAILEVVHKNNDFQTKIFELNEIKLKRSMLSRRGPVYDDISIHKLRELE